MPFPTRSRSRALVASLLVALPVLGPVACGGGDDGPTAVTPPPPPPAPTTSAVAAAYLDTAVSFTYAYFYFRDRLNWDAWYDRAVQRANGAQKPSDTYAALDTAVRELRDPHSYFLRPSQSAGFSENPSTAYFTPMSAVSQRVAYLWVPTFTGKTPAGRADTIQRVIAKVDSSPNLCGWIIDLRGNPGGHWPAMLAGLSPLVTPGRVGGFVTRSNERVFYDIRPGAASVVYADTTITYMQLARSYQARNAGLPIAILQGPSTASAGEIIVMAFKEPGRTVRTFGAPTYGVTSQPYTYVLRDTASLQITAALMFDRQNKTYGGGSIPPDQEVTGPTIRSSYAPGTQSDAVIEAATAWLNTQASCAAAPSPDVWPSRAPLGPAGGVWRQTAPIPGALPPSAWPKDRGTPWIAGGPMTFGAR